MDPAVLAQQATDILIPALSALCIAGKPAVYKGKEVLVDMIYEKAFEKLGSGGGKRAQALLEKISPKMIESLKKALTNVSKNSEDPKAKEELQQEILKLLKENPDLAREIEIIITFDLENVDQLIVGNYNNIFNIETKSVEQTIEFIKYLDKRKKFSKTYEDRFEENQEHSLVVPNNPYKIFLEITSPYEGAEVDINEEVRGKVKKLIQ